MDNLVQITTKALLTQELHKIFYDWLNIIKSAVNFFRLYISRKRRPEVYRPCPVTFHDKGKLASSGCL